MKDVSLVSACAMEENLENQCKLWPEHAREHFAVMQMSNQM